MIIETDQSTMEKLTKTPAHRVPSPEAPPAYDAVGGPSESTTVVRHTPHLDLASVGAPAGAMTTDKISLEHRLKDISGMLDYNAMCSYAHTVSEQAHIILYQGRRKSFLG